MQKVIINATLKRFTSEIFDEIPTLFSISASSVIGIIVHNVFDQKSVANYFVSLLKLHISTSLYISVCFDAEM